MNDSLVYAAFVLAIVALFIAQGNQDDLDILKEHLCESNAIEVCETP